MVRVATSGVLCVDGATPALDAFGALRAHGVSALGVLSDDGRLVDNLSVSDLRCVLPDRFGVLAAPLRCFLELEAVGAGAGGAHGAGPRGVVSVRPDATLLDALHALCAHGLHHVFVVDGDGAPLAVVSTADVLRLATVPP